MSVFSGLNQLKEALEDTIHENHKVTPAGHNKTQEEVRSEIRGEEKKVHEIQKRTGWSDRVSSQACLLDVDLANSDHRISS